MTSNEIYSYSAANTTTDGVYSQIMYCVAGSAELYDENNNKVRELTVPKDIIIDFRDFYNKPYYFKAGQNGASWLCINPVPANKFYTATTINSNDKITINGSDREQVIYCVEGNVNVNDKNLKQFQYARVLNGQVANVHVDIDSTALYFHT